MTEPNWTELPEPTEPDDLMDVLMLLALEEQEAFRELDANEYSRLAMESRRKWQESGGTDDAANLDHHRYARLAQLAREEAGDHGDDYQEARESFDHANDWSHSV